MPLAPAPINFALPIAHQTSADYTAFTGAIILGRPFRQPVRLEDDWIAFVDGLEFFLKDTVDDRVETIYAMFDGELEAYKAEAPGSSLSAPLLSKHYNRLLLNIDPKISKILMELRNSNILPIVEAVPKEIVYENVDFFLPNNLDGGLPKTWRKLVDLLKAAYLQTEVTSDWHPSMRSRVQYPNPDKPGFPLEEELKAYLDRFNDKYEDELEHLVTAFLSGPSGAHIIKLLIRAGDAIGVATRPHFRDPLPAGLPAGFNPHRLTVRITDVCNQSINPLYYLHLLIQEVLPGSNFLNCLSHLSSHPLFTLYPVLTQPTLPPARVQLAGQTPFPLRARLPGEPLTPALPSLYRDLATFHHHLGFFSPLSWRYHPDTSIFNSIFFEAQSSDPSIQVPNLSPSQEERDKAGSLYSLYGQSISIIANALQVPSSLILAVVGSTIFWFPDGSFDEFHVRLEPLSEADRARLNNSTFESLYDAVVSTPGVFSNIVQAGESTTFDLIVASGRNWPPHVLAKRGAFALNDGRRYPIHAHTGENDLSLTPITFSLTVSNPEGRSWVGSQVTILEGFDTSAPTPWNGAAPVRSGAALTWDQLLTIVNATGGRHISVGLVPIPIYTVMSVFEWLHNTHIWADLVDALDSYLVLLSPGLPSTPGAYLHQSGSGGLMLIAQIALAAAAAAIRQGYALKATCFDLPMVLDELGALYHLSRHPVVDDNQIFYRKSNSWRTLYFTEYIEPAARFYNALGHQLPGNNHVNFLF